MRVPFLPNEVLIKIADEAAKLNEGVLAEPNAFKYDKGRQEALSRLCSTSRLFCEYARKERFQHVYLGIKPEMLLAARDILTQAGAARHIEILSLRLSEADDNDLRTWGSRWRSGDADRDAHISCWSAQISIHLTMIMSMCKAGNSLISCIRISVRQAVDPCYSYALFSSIKGLLSVFDLPNLTAFEIHTCDISVAAPFWEPEFTAGERQLQKNLDRVTRFCMGSATDASNPFHDTEKLEQFSAWLPKAFHSLVEFEAEQIYHSVEVPSGVELPLDPFKGFPHLKNLKFYYVELEGPLSNLVYALRRTLRRISWQWCSLDRMTDRWRDVFDALMDIPLEDAVFEHLEYTKGEGDEFDECYGVCMICTPYEDDKSAFKLFRERFNPRKLYKEEPRNKGDICFCGVWPKTDVEEEDELEKESGVGVLGMGSSLSSSDELQEVE